MVATAIAALAAASAAKAANASVRVSEETAERQLRAYISIEPDTVLNWARYKTHRILVRLHANNVGQTPGADTKYEFAMDVLPNPLPPGFAFGPPDRVHDANNTIFPRTDQGLPVFLGFHRTLTDQEYNDINSDKARLHAWGVLHYVDAFGADHTTKFTFSCGGPDFAARMLGNEKAFNGIGATTRATTTLHSAVRKAPMRLGAIAT